jgi:hypothetical protein
MLTSGFLITEDADTALNLCGTEGVRYACRLSDGRGLAAFDADRVRAFELGTYGQILNEVPPEEQEGWERIIHGPKRHVANGDERFILFPVPTSNISANAAFHFFSHIYNPRGAALVWDGAKATFYVLIETGPEWTELLEVESVWDCTVTEYRDARLEVPA